MPIARLECTEEVPCSNKKFIQLTVLFQTKVIEKNSDCCVSIMAK